MSSSPRPASAPTNGSSSAPGECPPTPTCIPSRPVEQRHRCSWQSMTATMTATRTANARLQLPPTARYCGGAVLSWTSATPVKQKLAAAPAQDCRAINRPLVTASSGKPGSVTAHQNGRSGPSTSMRYRTYKRGSLAWPLSRREMSGHEAMADAVPRRTARPTPSRSDRERALHRVTGHGRHPGVLQARRCGS